MKVIEVIPYRTFKEKLRIVKEHEGRGRIEIHSNYIYVERIEKGA